jgi:DNA-binding SARP family transcriptional activator
MWPRWRRCWERLAELPAAGRSDYARGVRFGVLGPLEVRADGELLTIKGVKERRLLGCLLSRANSVLPVSDIVEALWGADPPRSAAKSVQVYVVRLRKMLNGRAGENTLISRQGRAM